MRHSRHERKARHRQQHHRSTGSPSPGHWSARSAVCHGQSARNAPIIRPVRAAIVRSA